MMDDHDGELASFAADREKSAEHEEYLRNREAVLAASGHRDVTPLRVIGWVAYALAVVVFILFIVQLDVSSDPNGAAPLLLPIIAICLCTVGLWCALGPVLWESRSRGRRARNVVIAIVVNAIVAPLLVPLIVSVGSLIADLIGNLT
jgi:NADH:ubiquinone oxidoreductase subunit 6 (subunit J)